MKAQIEQELEEGCEFCGLKENCNNYKLGIKEGKALALTKTNLIEFGLIQREKAISEFKEKLKVAFYKEMSYKDFYEVLDKTAQEITG